MSEKAQLARSDKSTLQYFLEMLVNAEEENEEKDYEASRKADAITDPNDPNRIAYIESLVEVGRPSLCDMTIMASQINTRMVIAILDKNLNRYEKCISSIQILQSQGDKAKMMLFVQQYINLIEELVSCDKDDVLGKGKLENQIQLIEESFAKEGYTIFGGMDAFKAIREADAFTEEDYEAAFALS